MKITIDGYIDNDNIHNASGDIAISGYFDPNGLVEKFRSNNPLVIEIELRISKKGNLVALVKDIRLA